jgi:hypothetical protein
MSKKIPRRTILEEVAVDEVKNVPLMHDESAGRDGDPSCGLQGSPAVRHRHTSTTGNHHRANNAPTQANNPAFPHGIFTMP